MRRAGFTPNRQAATDLLSGPAAAAYLGDAAEQIAWRIRQNTRKLSGVLSRSWRTKVTVEDGRPVAVVYTYSPRWHLEEYGTSDTTPGRPVTNAARSAGIRYNPTGKGGH